jgi:hypothetical protein
MCVCTQMPKVRTRTLLPLQITTVSARARPGRPRKPDSDCHWGLGTPHSWPSLSPTPPRASALRGRRRQRDPYPWPTEPHPTWQSPMRRIAGCRKQILYGSALVVVGWLHGWLSGQDPRLFNAQPKRHGIRRRCVRSAERLLNNGTKLRLELAKRC